MNTRRRGSAGKGGTKNRGRSDQLRMMIAREAARLLATDEAPDYQSAKTKAAQRVGIVETRNLPNNEEIMAALAEYQQLFQQDKQPKALRQLRKTALQAMDLFDRFSPRLVGAVLNGTATNNSDINLHLFTEPVEAVSLLLMEKRIPFEPITRTYYVDSDNPAFIPGVRFVAGDTYIEAAIFPLKSLRQLPRSTSGGQLIERASREALQRLLDDSPE